MYHSLQVAAAAASTPAQSEAAGNLSTRYTMYVHTDNTFFLFYKRHCWQVHIHTFRPKRGTTCARGLSIYISKAQKSLDVERPGTANSSALHASNQPSWAIAVVASAAH